MADDLSIEARSDGVVRLGAREIAAPSQVSEAARQVLGAPRGPVGWPDPADTDGWRRLIAARDAANAAAVAPFAARLKADVEARTMGGLPVYVGTPQGGFPW